VCEQLTRTAKDSPPNVEEEARSNRDEERQKKEQAAEEERKKKEKSKETSLRKSTSNATAGEDAVRPSLPPLCPVASAWYFIHFEGANYGADVSSVCRRQR
jgi:hypothetical protein